MGTRWTVLFVSNLVTKTVCDWLSLFISVNSLSAPSIVKPGRPRWNPATNTEFGASTFIYSPASCQSHTAIISESSAPVCSTAQFPQRVCLEPSYLWEVDSIDPSVFHRQGLPKHQGELRSTHHGWNQEERAAKLQGDNSSGTRFPNKKEETLIQNSYSKNRGILLTHPRWCLGHSQME